MLSLIALAVAADTLLHETPLFPQLQQSTSARAAETVRFLSTTSGEPLPEAKLGRAGLEYSGSQLGTMMTSGAANASQTTEWRGWRTKAFPDAIFAKTWKHDGATITWADNGLVVTLVITDDQKVAVNSAADAQRHIEAELRQVLNLPSVEADAIKWEPDRLGETGFEGLMSRGVITQKGKLATGEEVDMIMHPIAWHHMIYAATDGQTVIAKFPFNDGSLNPDQSEAITDPEKRLPKEK